MAPVFIVTIVIAASLILVKMVLDYNRAKMIDDRATDPERSLPASELTTLIRESVADEIRPLVEKIERLEKHAGEEMPAMDLDEHIDPDADTAHGDEADRISRPAKER